MKTKDKFILIVLFFVVCLNCKSQEIQKIDVKCVDIRIETPFGITCEMFEGFFKGIIDTISIKDQDRIAVFSRIIKELKEVDRSKYSLPDTRIKIEIIHKDKKTIMCIDHLVMSISDNLYLTSDAMLEFIEETIKSKSEKEGNNRVVVNQASAVQQVNYYYAFGGLFGEEAQTVSQRYRYNGKELDTELGLNMYNYGARHYDTSLGCWFTVDPLAEKYYGISPYVYVANNPVRFIDPNGKEIWLYEYDEDGNCIAELKYSPGMKYDGDSYFTSAITTLNQMNSVKNGSMVLSELHVSKNIFGVTNQRSSTEGTGQFIEIKNGGGTMKMGGSFSLENMSHEIFHGYQHEMGQGGASIYNEVEANLFGYSLAFEYMLENTFPLSSSTLMGWKNSAGVRY